MKKSVQINRHTQRLGGPGNSWGEANARRAAPTAPGAAARPRYGAHTPHQYMATVCLWFPCIFLKYHVRPEFSTASRCPPARLLRRRCSPRPSRSALRCAAARGGNSRRIRPNWWPDLCRRWINFWLCFQSSAFEMLPHKKAFFPIQRRRNLLV